MKNKFKNIYLPILLFITLLLGMAYFQYIPAKLLKINLETISTTSKIVYSIICDALFMLFVYLLYRKTINKNFKDFFSNFKDNIETSLKYYFIGLAIMVISNLIITILFSGASANNEEAVRTLIEKYPLHVDKIAVMDQFGQVGKYSELLNYYHLTSNDIYNVVKKNINK